MSQTGLMRMDYDSLGNMTARDTWTDCLDNSESDCTDWEADWLPDESTKSSSAAWTYDYAGSSAANAPKGALIKTTSTTALAPNNTFTLTQETTAWDKLHRPAESRTSLPNVAELGELAG